MHLRLVVSLYQLDTISATINAKNVVLPCDEFELKYYPFNDASSTRMCVVVQFRKDIELNFKYKDDDAGGLSVLKELLILQTTNHFSNTSTHARALLLSRSHFDDLHQTLEREKIHITLLIRWRCACLASETICFLRYKQSQASWPMNKTDAPCSP